VVPLLLAVLVPVLVLRSNSSASVVENYFAAAQTQDGSAASRVVCPESRAYVESSDWVADLGAIQEQYGALREIERRRGTSSAAVVYLDFSGGARKLVELTAPELDGRRCLVIAPGRPLGQGL